MFFYSNTICIVQYTNLHLTYNHKRELSKLFYCLNNLCADDVIELLIIFDFITTSSICANIIRRARISIRAVESAGQTFS